MHLTYHTLNAFCIEYDLTHSEMIHILQKTNLEACIYLSNLKTYLVDCTLVNDLPQKYAIQTFYLKGLFYLDTADTCDILCNGTCFISKLRATNNGMINLAHPQKVCGADLLLDHQTYHLLHRHLFNKPIQIAGYPLTLT